MKEYLSVPMYHPFWEEIYPYINDLVFRNSKGLLNWVGSQSGNISDKLEQCMILRDKAMFQYGYSIPSPFLLGLIKQFVADRPIVEMGAGMGYWAYMLMQFGIWVDAFDEEPWPVPWHFWHPVQQGTPAVLRNYPDHVLFLSWPSFNDDWAYEALRFFKGAQLILVAETACCANDKFYDELNRHWKLVDSGANFSWGYIKDCFYFYRRKTEKQ